MLTVDEEDKENKEHEKEDENDEKEHEDDDENDYPSRRPDNSLHPVTSSQRCINAFGKQIR